LSHQKLVEKAKSSGLYDLAQTVASVRRARKGEGEETSSSSSSVEKPMIESETISVPIEVLMDDDVEAHVVFEESNMNHKHVYILPDDAMILLKIKAIIHQFPGNITVQIGGMDINLSEE
jgi:hypothetical protein